LTLALCGWSVGSWDEIQVSYKPMDNPSNRYSKDPVYTMSSDVPSISGTFVIWQPNNTAWVSSGTQPINASTIPFSYKDIKVKVEHKQKKNHIEIDIIPILNQLGRLEIADEA